MSGCDTTSTVDSTLPARLRLRFIGAVVGTLMALQTPSWGTQVVWASPAPEIRITVIQGKLCARCTLRGGANAIPANVMIDLGTPAPLLVHERTAGLLQIQRDTPVELSFDEVTLSDLPAIPTGLRVLEELTSEHATELGEIPAVAILGLPAFSDFTLVVELSEGTLRLLPADGTSTPTPADAIAGAAGNEEGMPAQSEVLLEQRGFGYWLDGVGPEDFEVRVRFATSDSDTLIDATVADLLGAPAGDLDRLEVGGINVAEYVALRPEDLATGASLRPDLVLGTNFLSHFRMTIGAAAGRLQLEQIRPPRFPSEERAYFVAREDEDAEAIESFLTAHPSSRLAGEASETLLAHRLDEYPPAREAIARAVRLRALSTRPQRRATRMIALADELLAGDRDGKQDLAADVLAVGQEFAPGDLDARAAHQIQSRLGAIALERGELKQARRHLLSAAFGMPRDPLVNLRLGEFYERSGKLVRAWSRYVQAAIHKDAPSEALVGLDRLNRSAELRAAFTMADAEQLLEGRVLEFHPPDRYQRTDQASGPRPVRLIELFTCLDHPATTAADLAFGGLGEYFEREEVAFLAYHLPAPATDPLASEVSAARASFYDVKAVPSAYFDGARLNSEAGGEDAVDRVFAAYKQACLAQRPDQDRWTLGGRVSLSGTSVSGQIELTGPEGPPTLRLCVVLCERAVMLPGANGVLMHRHVARGAVGAAEGLPVPVVTGRRIIDVSVDLAEVSAAVERTIANVEQERSVEFLMKPTYVDAGACQLVVFLQDQQSRQVLAACTIPVVKQSELLP